MVTRELPGGIGFPFAKPYVKAMWSILQQDEPDDYVVATGESHSVHDFVREAFGHAAERCAEANSAAQLGRDNEDVTSGSEVTWLKPITDTPRGMLDCKGDRAWIEEIVESGEASDIVPCIFRKLKNHCGPASYQGLPEALQNSALDAFNVDLQDRDSRVCRVPEIVITYVGFDRHGRRFVTDREARH